jgi:hypothetical protein
MEEFMILENTHVFVLALFLSFFVLTTPVTANETGNRMQEETFHNTDQKTREVDPNAPSDTVKLIFIHHSVGGRWLTHDYGGLVHELNKNNYYVNDITYGWEPPELTSTQFKKIRRKFSGWFGSDSGAHNIGNRTDIGHWHDWFAGPDSALIMESVYKENSETDRFGNHGNKTSGYPLANPGAEIENEIIMIKPCYPNTLLKGEPNDTPTAGSKPSGGFSAKSEEHTVANCKRIFNDILSYFQERQDKFFVIVTAPPQVELPDSGRIARGFSNWLYYDWLKENNYSHNNVFVFDLYNVLTSGHDWKRNDAGEENGNHHRIWEGQEQHVFGQGANELVYPSDGNNNHPSPAGLQKATREFVDLLNYHYNRWEGSTVQSVEY